MGIVLSCQNLSRSFDARPLFEEVTFAIHEGDRVGLIGANGSGKSTLMRLMADLDIPDEGERATASGLRTTYLQQQDVFAPEDTAYSVLLKAATEALPQRDEHEHEVSVQQMLHRLDFDGPGPAQDALVNTFSGGWRKRLSIGRALITEADLLLMDEPTNHLDLEGIWWLEDTLANLRSTFVMISHDRSMLERCCTRIIELSHMHQGGCFCSQGGYATFLEKRAELQANQERQQAAMSNALRREVEYLRRKPPAQRKQSKARVDAAAVLKQDLEAMRWRCAPQSKVGIDFTSTGRRANELVSCEGVSKTLGGKLLFTEVELSLGPGDRLGIMGLNGSGKTTLLKILAKQMSPDAGIVKHAVNLNVVIFDQKRERLDPNTTLRKALCPTGETVVWRGSRMHVAAWAKRFCFQPGQLDQLVGKLSGGEQARVLLANLMQREADILILDEPTNDLDIATLEVLEDSLRDFPGVVMLVTHDRHLLDRVCTSLLALDGAGSAFRVADSDQWEDLARRIQKAREAGFVPETSVATVQPVTKKIGMGLKSNERRELEALPEKIERAEAVRTAVETRLADPKVATNPVMLKDACDDLAKAQTEIDALYARWQQLEAKSQG